MIPVSIDNDLSDSVYTKYLPCFCYFNPEPDSKGSSSQTVEATTEPDSPEETVVSENAESSVSDSDSHPVISSPSPEVDLQNPEEVRFYKADSTTKTDEVKENAD